MLCVSMEILSRDRVKNKTETVKGFKFCSFIGRFYSGIMAGEGVTSTETMRLIRDGAKGRGRKGG